jgi:hypothetical protein
MMSRLLYIGIIVIFAISGFSSSSFSEVRNFDNPEYEGYSLDWCRSWGEECGLQAADTWCERKGYLRSQGFSKWNDIGKPTKLVGTRQICDEPICDSFKRITCFRFAEEVEPYKFVKPAKGTWRVDWCLTWGEGCGKPAAEFYCQSKQRGKVLNFKIDEDMGRTMILQTGEKCTDPSCDAFKYITCE